MALKAVNQFPVKVNELRFIHYGENATFKVIADQQSYLLRLHRPENHTSLAIQEELSWVSYLKENSNIHVQSPVKSKQGKFVVKQGLEHIPTHLCTLLSWKDGRRIFKGLAPKHYLEVGMLTAKLHDLASSWKTQHRRYWDAAGLIGPNASYGPPFALKEVLNPTEFKILSDYQMMITQKISAYEKKNPQNMSFIHADLHFGNLLWNKGKITPIDFDDCGYGSYMYDLAVILFSSRMIFQDFDRCKREQAILELLKGYSQNALLCDEDLAIIPYYVEARKLTMFAWLYHRIEHPTLRAYFEKNKSERIKNFKKSLKKPEFQWPF